MHNCTFCYIFIFLGSFDTCVIVMHRYPVGGEMKYAAEAQELIRPERNTLRVSFEDVERHNQQLATTVLEEYYRCCLCLWSRP